ncbi:MAG TPA: biotin--[acetyl-CoA-carboxylase] ligase [Cryomorphaceae bacterium]|nr:biotin--[acetyl-CoA-carboxylase] ligase [Cryomorphaceae bacterium]
MAKHIIEFESLDSTSNYVANRLRDGTYSDGDVIMAHFQTYGRGQRQNTWQSEPGQNICFSYAVRFPKLTEASYFMLSKSISLALVDFLSRLQLTDVRIKWPNDILVGERKIAGILIDHIKAVDKRFFVVGIGLNVNQKSFSGFSATSIASETLLKYHPAKVLKDILAIIDKYEGLLADGRIDEIEMAYLNALYGTSDWVSFRDAQHSFMGRIKDVAPSGEILVRSKNGYSRTYRMGEVKINY